MTLALTDIVFGLMALAVSWLGTRAVLDWLRRRQIVDVPNHRSSHDRPTPRGGGIGLLLGLLPALAVFAVLADRIPTWAPLIVAALGLALISWRDDLGHVAARWRLLAQAAAVALGLLTLGGAPVFQGLLPPWADMPAAALLWIWYVNLTNFMDGIDGISGVEAVSLGLGLALVGLATDAPIAPALIVAGAALGFLWWNWHPAKLFMGDVGSVPLGYLLGGLLLALAASGLWAPALILPAYYLCDATWTLGRRLVQGKRIWEAHREHLYQRAVQRGWSHARVSIRVAVTNAGLIALALWSLTSPWSALAAAYLLAGATLLRFARI